MDDAVENWDLPGAYRYGSEQLPGIEDPGWRRLIQLRLGTLIAMTAYTQGGLGRVEQTPPVEDLVLELIQPLPSTGKGFTLSCLANLVLARDMLNREDYVTALAVTFALEQTLEEQGGERIDTQTRQELTVLTFAEQLLLLGRLPNRDEKHFDQAMARSLPDPRMGDDIAHIYQNALFDALGHPSGIAMIEGHYRRQEMEVSFCRVYGGRIFGLTEP